jgi:hypothetical protein
MEWGKYFKEQEIADLSDGGIKAEDIILLPVKQDYGCKDKYPLDLMTFYKNDTNLEAIRGINDFEYGLSKPRRNQVCYMRIFVRDPSKFNEA